MVTTTAEFKVAIKKPGRNIKRRVIFSGLSLTLDNDIVGLKIESNLVGIDDFLFGTAMMDTASFTLAEDSWTGTTYPQSFEGQECEIQVGIQVPSGSTEYVSMGLFTVEKVVRDQGELKMELVDRMYKTDVEFTAVITYPATMLSILQSAASQSGLVLETTTFANSGYQVSVEVPLEGVTCRTVIANIAELAGGFAKITRAGKLQIKTLSNTSRLTLAPDNVLTLRELETASGTIDKLIVKIGDEKETRGTGTNLYTVVDNLFIQTPGAVIAPLFGVVSLYSYKPVEQLEWTGDPSVDVGDRITYNGDNIYLLRRQIDCGSGLTEVCAAPNKSNIERNSTGVDNIVIDINKVKTQIKRINGEITQVIENSVGRSEWQQTVDGFTQRVTSVEENIDGIKAWTIVIYSTNGNVFKNDNIHTTLVARVYKGTDDITDTLDANRFKWTRVSADTDSDILWNAANFGGTKNITVTPDDVQNRATFNVTISEL